MSLTKQVSVSADADWNSVTNKPTLYPPQSHTHQSSDVSGVPSKYSDLVDDVGVRKLTDSISYNTLVDKPTIPAPQVPVDWNSVSSPTMILNKPSLFSGAYSDLQGKPNLAAVCLTGSYNDLSDKPTIPVIAYPVSSVNTKTGAVILSATDVGAALSVHTHAISSIMNLQTTLDSKSDTGHTHTIANVTGLQSALDSKATAASLKRQETYSGVSDGNGLYTVTFATPYAVAPNIQTQIVNGTNNHFLRVSSITTTGFSVSVGLRASLTVLGLNLLSFDVTPVSGLSVDVLITSK